METLKVKLDREREIRFSFSALATLARECKINVNDPEFFRAPFSPDALAGLVWVGQLHTKNPLTKAQVETHMPMDWDSTLELYAGLVARLMHARGVKSKAEETSGESVDPT